MFTRLRAEVNWHRMFHELIQDLHPKSLAKRQKEALEAADLPLPE